MQIGREKILEEITKKVTRSDSKHFTNTDRLDCIKEMLNDSDYEIYEETPLSVIYKKKKIDLPEKVVLISSHVDCVDDIRNPHFEITKKGNYRGTFDNAATNAAAVIVMLENRLSDNVIVSFTGEEERNSKGAKQVIKFLESKKKKVIAISLDVTLDLESEESEEITTYKYASYTIDNLCDNTKKSIAKALFKKANDLMIPFMVTRAEDSRSVKDYFSDKEDDIPKYYDPMYEVKDTAYEDEALRYARNKCCIGAFSLCLPSDDTESDWNMHSDTLIEIKKKSFSEYIEAVIEISNL